MKISVVTGFYNRAHVLERTVRSVMSQEDVDFELLVFDDASTDGTAAALAKLSEELSDPRFRYVSFEKNRGFAQGLRDAIEMTAGEYVAIQGSGDISLPRRLKLQSELLDRRADVGAVGTWYNNVEEGSETRRLRKPEADSVDFPTLLRGNIFSHGEVMIRRDVYESVGGYRAEFQNCQDYDLWLRIIQTARIATVPELLYERYIQFDGVTYDPRKVAKQSRYSTLARRMAQMPPLEAERALDKLRTTGIESLVPLSDPELQKKYIKGSIRFAVWGSADDAVSLARECVVNPAKRVGLIAFARTYNSPFGRPLRFVIRRALGLRRDEESMAA